MTDSAPNPVIGMDDMYKFPPLVPLARAFLAYKARGRATPLLAGFKITHRCNLRCGHCPYWKRSGTEVDFQSAVETLRSLRKLGAQILIFEGGEPLLWRDGAYTFRDIARVAGSMFGAVCVTTNGTIPWHDLPVNRVWVSLDGPAGVHDSIRGEGVYDRVLEHIRKRPGRVMVSATINRFNAEAIPEMIRGLRGLAAGVTVQFHYPYEGRPDPWFIEPEERGPVLEELIRLKKAGFPVANSIGSLRDMKHAPWTCIDGFLANAEPDGSIRVGCYLKNRGIADCAACGFAAHNEMSLAFKGRIGSIIAGARIFFSG